MSNNELENKIKKIVSKITRMPTRKIDITADIFKYLGVDSLRAIEIIAVIEKKYKISIPPKKIVKLRTIKQIIDFLEDAKKN